MYFYFSADSMTIVASYSRLSVEWLHSIFLVNFREAECEPPFPKPTHVVSRL
jgi:hypothetical protein